MPRQVRDPSECFFYHTIDVPGFGVQDGGWDLRGRFADYTGHVDLAGRRVLDLGTASGFLSFSAEDAGARDVVSFDLDDASRQDLLPFVDKPWYQDRAQWNAMQTQSFAWWKNGYWLCHRLRGSKARVFYGDIYALPPGLGQFDVAIVGAILEHLADPIRALTSIARRTNGTMVINTDYLDTPGPLAHFNGRADRPDNDFVFWTYSLAVYESVLDMLGFDVVRVEKNAFPGVRPSPAADRPMLPRAAIVADRRAGTVA